MRRTWGARAPPPPSPLPSRFPASRLLSGPPPGPLSSPGTPVRGWGGARRPRPAPGALQGPDFKGFDPSRGRSVKYPVPCSERNWVRGSSPPCPLPLSRKAQAHDGRESPGRVSSKQTRVTSQEPQFAAEMGKYC